MYSHFVCCHFILRMVSFALQTRFLHDNSLFLLFSFLGAIPNNAEGQGLTANSDN